MSRATNTEEDVEVLSLELPPEPALIGMSRLFAGAVARHFWCDEDTVDDIKIAISEAVTNSVKAHKDEGSPEPIRIAALGSSTKLTFEIVDQGSGIQEHHLEASASATPSQGLFEGSLGLSVIRALFPDARIEPNPDRGTTVRFSVAVKGPEAEATG